LDYGLVRDDKSAAATQPYLDSEHYSYLYYLGTIPQVIFLVFGIGMVYIMLGRGSLIDQTLAFFTVS